MQFVISKMPLQHTKFSLMKQLMYLKKFTIEDLLNKAVAYVVSIVAYCTVKTFKF